MTLNLSIPDEDSDVVKGGRLVLEIQSQLQEKGIPPTEERVMAILSEVDKNMGILSWDAKEVIRLALAFWILWMEHDKNDLKTKQWALKELEFLRQHPWEVSKSRVGAFFLEVIRAESPKTISSEIGIWEKEVWDYLLNNAWAWGMGDNLYDALKSFIEKSYK